MSSMSMPVVGLIPRATSDEPADLVVRNARIFTGDPRRQAASALAICDGVITAIGDDHDVAQHVLTQTRLVDARNRRVIPGFMALYQG